MTFIRFVQRLENFQKAYSLLYEALQSQSLEEMNDLEKEGLIQRFEYTYELSWKCLKDYLEYSGVILEPLTPRQVIKEAFVAQLIENGDAWIAMLESRNRMSHDYDRKYFEETMESIAFSFVPLFGLLLEKLQGLAKEQ